MKKIILTIAVLGIASVFTACGDDSSSSSASCEVKTTSTGLQVVQSIPLLGEYTSDYTLQADGTYKDGYGQIYATLDEAKAAAQNDCDNFNKAE